MTKHILIARQAYPGGPIELVGSQSTPGEHAIAVAPKSDGSWVSTCSCGKYLSGPASESDARKRGEEHASAKE